ncbi:BTAD domain-containing putative transcriptional regulator [Actinomycetospora termitidis]|uniref:BTAD domain-containing putative transcriptional regulator n=1 Tax=Actinomycetospora termitidis TaxID=3053470 RepID=A0ABT7M7I6_9PSEU|nr:BTAD domain-containing putative transcriptional regulator [Actinomycetospora sp. Odt1-22]MDL5156416.1 BTAD domain-containing putative transcriptional regulator [Actinomycetospora sp. Odt1-22]
MLRVDVSGDVRASIDGRPLDLGGPRQRAVLGMLVAARGRTVSTDRFIEDLWSGGPPPKALGALQAYVSHLRRQLEPDRAPRTPATVLVSAAPGYRLALRPEQVDVWDTVRTVDAARAAADPAEALALALRSREGRSETPFAAYADEAWAADEIARLAEVHAVAAEIAGEAALAVGRPADVLEVLGGLVRAEPLRESATALLARALAAAGRQGDALTVLREHRTRLADDLGLDPGAPWHAAQDAILAGGAVVAPPRPPAPPVVETPDDAFLGRVDELARLHRARDAGPTRAGIVWVAAEAGVGKSALAERFAREVADAGSEVHRARCPEVDGAPPGWAWRDLVARATGTASTASDPFGLATAVERALGADAVVVCEDVHRADGETLQVLRHLVAGRDVPVLVVATYRDDEVSDDLRATLALLATHTRDRIHLRGLDPESARRLLRRAAGRDVADRTWRTLLARAAGNALFLRELGGLVRSEGDEVATRGLPSGVGDVLGRRLARLPARAVATLTRAAVLGRDVDVDLMLEVDALRGPLTEDELLDDLDTGLVTGLLESDPALRFTHALVRDTVAARMPPLRRARLHRALLDALESRHPDRVHGLAHHAELALDRASASRALPHLVAGATSAHDAGAVDDAVRWWRAALRALDLGAGGTAERLRVHRELVRSLAASGDLVGALSERHRAIDEARRTGDPTDEAWVWSWDVVALWATRPALDEQDAAIARLQELLGLVDPSDRRLRTELLLALAHESQPWLVELGRAAGDEALVLARELDDPRLLCRALAVAHLHTFAVADPDHQRRVGEEMLAVATRARLGDHRALAHLVLSAAAVGRGDLDAARSHLDGATATAGTGQLPVLALSVAVFAATLDLVHGRVDAARAAFDELTARITASGDPNGPVIRAWVMTTVAAAAGDCSVTLAELEAITTAGGGGFVAVLRVLALLDAGREDDARALWPLPPYPREATWLLETAFQCVAACRLGDDAVVRRTREELRPWAGQLVRTGNGQLVLGPVDLVLARAAATLGEDPRPAAEAAVALARRLDAPQWLAEARGLLDRSQVARKWGGASSPP